jgi:hypothetical protein
MAAVGEYDLAAQLRHGACQIGDDPIHTWERQCGVASAGHVKCGHSDLRAIKRRQQLPIFIDVAIPVQTAAKPRALEFAERKNQGLLPLASSEGGQGLACQ